MANLLKVLCTIALLAVSTPSVASVPCEGLTTPDASPPEVRRRRMLASLLPTLRFRFTTRRHRTAESRQALAPPEQPPAMPGQVSIRSSHHLRWQLHLFWNPVEIVRSLQEVAPEGAVDATELIGAMREACMRWRRQARELGVSNAGSLEEELAASIARREADALRSILDLDKTGEEP